MEDKNKPLGFNKPRSPMPEAHRRAISESKKGKPLTEKQLAGISRANLGKPKSEAHKRAMSEARKGVQMTPEAIAKAVATKRANGTARRQPIPVEIHGVRYKSQTEAAQALGVSQANISIGMKVGRPGYVRLGSQ